MLSLILYLNAAHRNLAEEKVVLNYEIFCENFGDLGMEGVATAHAEILMFVRGLV